MITHTHLELDILQCEVRWAVRSITTNKARALVGSAALLFVFSVTNHKINRLEGGLMLLMFATY